MKQKIINKMKKVMKNRQKDIDAMENSGQMDAIGTIMGLIKDVTK